MRKNLRVLTLILALIFGVSTMAFAGPIPEITILTTTEAYDPIRYEAAFLIKEAWEKLGLRVNVQPLEFSTLIQRFYNEQNFDIAIVGWSGRVERLDPQHFLGTLHSEQTDVGGNNPGGYFNPTFDDLFEKQAVEFDVNKRRELVLEAQAIAMVEQPLSILFYRDEVVAYNNTTFKGFVPMAGEAIYNEWLPFTVEPVGNSRTLTIGTSQEPDNINPLDSTTVWGWKFMRLYYDKLVRLSPDIEPVPWAARSIDPIDDLTIEVVLRSGMTFHDGKPVTVEDIKFTYEYFMEKDFAYFRPFYRPLDRVDIIDSNTLHFILKEPVANFITVTMSQIPILPKHLWENIHDPSQLSPDEVPTIGSGPMKFDRYDRGEYKRLVKFEDHFRAREIDIDAIDYIIYADTEGVFTGMITQQVDMTAWRMEPAQIGLAEQEPHLSVVSVPDFGYYHMTYNLRTPPFDDIKFRQAIAHAIPKRTFVDVLLDGRGEPGTSVIAPVNTFWHNYEVRIYEYNLDLAMGLLRQAGYQLDSSGRLNFPE